MPSYCTLQGARRQLETGDQTINLKQDTNLFFYALTAAASIDDWTGYWFDERVLTLGFNGDVGANNPMLYLKEQPLISIDTLTNGNGDVIGLANYTLLPTGGYPKQKVRLAKGYYWRGPGDAPGSTTIFSTWRSPILDKAYAEDAIQIAGRWVFHRNYPKAWKRITLTVGADLDDSSTTLTLSAQAGTAFDVGNILRIGTEQLLVDGPIVSSKPLDQGGFLTTSVSVERAYNGTESAAHATGTVIDVWQPDGMIENITEMAAAALYKGRDNATGDAQIVQGFAKMVIPVDLPAKIKGFLVPYRSWRRGRP